MIILKKKMWEKALQLAAMYIEQQDMSTAVDVMFIKKLPSKVVPNPFCILSLNQVKVARTKVKTGPDPVWDEEFILDDVPPDVLTFTVTVYNKGKRSKDTEVAELTVELSSLTNGDEDSRLDNPANTLTAFFCHVKDFFAALELPQRRTP
ncbi:Ras GTPase-activating protein 1 [Homalodisca vitripennis]|nr:Ras GTPase-activating protein 1 [Homalodisca vitripennis]